MVTYPENVQRNRWLGILDLILRTGNGVLEGPPGPPVVGGGCDSIQNGGQIRINPPPPQGDLAAPLHYWWVPCGSITCVTLRCQFFDHFLAFLRRAQSNIGWWNLLLFSDKSLWCLQALTHSRLKKNVDILGWNSFLFGKTFDLIERV